MERNDVRHLIVEDDRDVAVTIRSLLATRQGDSLIAPSATEGLDLLRSHNVDVILLDVNLPGGLSGYAACEAFRNLRPAVPIILMTGAYTSDADARVARAVGASGFLRKPFDADTLFDAIQAARTGVTSSPHLFLSFHCDECGAEGRIRDANQETIRFRCPNCGSVRAMRREERQPARSPRAPGAPEALRRRILVVDSTEHFRLYLFDLLTEAGHSVVTAREGGDALRLAREWSPDIIITDLILPGMDGLALCRAIRVEPGLTHIAVATLTSLRNEDHVTHAEEAGVDLFLLKPIRVEDFFERLNELIARRPR
jgi:CheY-like chemotaxis protein/DNA-directed RNA polymerase subunit RPC12/RpoP